MRKSSDRFLFYTFFCHASVSVLAAAFILRTGLAAVQFGVAQVRVVFGIELAYLVKSAIGDAACFALVSAMTALAQYYLTSLPPLCRSDRGTLLAVSGCSAFLAGLFFWRAAEFSSLGAYGFSGLPVFFAALIGGAAAITRKTV